MGPGMRETPVEIGAIERRDINGVSDRGKVREVMRDSQRAHDGSIGVRSWHGMIVHKAAGGNRAPP